MLRWVNAQLGRILGWVERAFQQEVIGDVYFSHLRNFWFVHFIEFAEKW